MSPSLYPITQKSNRYFFVTDSGHTYEVYFDSQKGIFPEGVLDEHAVWMGFVCRPKRTREEKKQGNDEKIGATIMHLVANLFSQRKWALLIYICSDEDGQDRERSILFKRWYKSSPFKEKIEHLTSTFKNENDLVEYGGVFFHKKHPNRDEIELTLQTFNPYNKNTGSSLVEEEDAYSDYFDEY